MEDLIDRNTLIFYISVEDVQYKAVEKLGRELTDAELHSVKKGVAWGLDMWDDVVGYAIDEVKSNIPNEDDDEDIEDEDNDNENQQ